MVWAEGAREKLRQALGDQGDIKRQPHVSLYSFNCPKCGYKAIRKVKELTCGCGQPLQGTLVFYKVMGQVVFDNRYPK